MPYHADSLNNLGRCLNARAEAGTTTTGDVARAFDMWMRALDVDPTHRMARMNVSVRSMSSTAALQVALALHSNGQYASALEQWNMLLESHPEDAEIAYNAAVSMQYLGQVEGAASL